MNKISRRRTAFWAAGRRWTRLNARVGEPDPSLTENGGLLLVAELDRALGITAELDAGIGRVKERDRGLSGGEFALSMAVVQLTGEDHLVGFDRLRADTVGEGLLSAPVPPSTTAATLAARFGQVQREGLERASAQVKIPVIHRDDARGHGRHEQRLVQVVTVNGLLFPHAAQVLRIQRRRRLYGAKKWSSETVYAITDLPAEEASAAEIASWARGHWTVENTVHWCRDVTFSEDKSQEPTTRPQSSPPSAT